MFHQIFAVFFSDKKIEKNVNPLALDGSDFDSCRISLRSIVLQTGHDQNLAPILSLVTGSNGLRQLGHRFWPFPPSPTF